MRPPNQSRLLLALFSVVLIAVHTSAQGDGDAAPGPAPTPSAAASNSTSSLSNACQTRLQQLSNFQQSNLPVVFIQLVNTSQVAGATPAQLQLLAKGPHLPGLITTCGAPDGSDVEDAPMRMHVRGQSSAAEYAKKSFALDPLDQIADLASADTIGLPLLGLPKDNNWVLHGPENDRTLGMRNWLGYNAARRMGRYASRTKYFELFLNTNPGTPLTMDHYRGVYMLQEKVARGKHRVNVTKYDGSVDPSGGYLLAYENDNVGAKDVLLQARLSKLTLIQEYPKGNNETATMWIQQWLNAFEGKLLREPVANLSDVLDVPAAVDYFIITEITKNPDGYRGSIKMHKDRGGPLVLGPIWDLNEAFGLCCGYPIEGYKMSGRSNGTSGGSAISAAGWRFNICQDPGRCRVEPADGISQWYRRLWQDATFRTAAAARWQELRAPANGTLRDEWFVNEIDSLKQLLGSGPGTAGQRNFQKYSSALNIPGFGVPYADWATMFNAETVLLKDWVLARLKWLDAAFAAQALLTAAPDAYLAMGYVVAEPAPAGPVQNGGGLVVAGGMPAVQPAVAGK